ncbi:MAG: 50S ribosomal protein L18 [Thermodesulfobacteriota bacterium]
MADISRSVASDKRAKRVRYTIRGTSARPRITVFRSNRNIFAQIIDDSRGVTLCQASTMDKDFRRKAGEPFTKDLARQVGRRLAERAKEQNIVTVVFDRGPYLYHGKVRALADGAREGGLDF